MTNTKDIILKLKEVREEKKLSFQDIMRLMEQNGAYTSKSTLSRVFSDGSEDLHFKYEETIRPIANALLDMETIEEDDPTDIQAMKSLLKYKIDRITELERHVARLEAERDKEQIKHHEKLDRERERFNRSIDFLKHQIELKDERIDKLMESSIRKEEQTNNILEQLLTKCNNCEFHKTNK